MADDLLGSLRTIVGEGNVLTGDKRIDRSATWGTGQPCNARAIVRPSDTAQVAAVLKACHQAHQAVVPYGGLTNLVHGCVTTPDDIALSLEKMNRIEEVDETALTMTVQAGVTMREAQLAAERQGLYFPVDIGARDSCMIGGNVSSNAGGTKVIRYGMMRDRVLGLEAVLADGTVISSLNRFLKNNSGFDLKQLFIGTEGVLGVITRVVVRLDVQPRSHNVALVACRDFDAVIEVLNGARAALGSALCGFEVMWDNFFHEVVEPHGKLRSPVAPEHSFYVIIEAMGTQPGTDDEAFESALAEMFAADLVEDGSIAKSDAERESIWAIRHEVEWVVRDAYIFDVSLPVASAAQYVTDITAAIRGDIESARIAAFGHLGDNNIHVSVLTDEYSAREAEQVAGHIYESLRPYGGAISAEHGIGLQKKPYLPISRSAEEIDLMRALKKSLDPRNILNPGKVISQR